MSILIDDLVRDYNKEQTSGKFYITKPLDKWTFRKRLKEALHVLYGYSRTYHYFVDEADTWGEIKD